MSRLFWILLEMKYTFLKLSELVFLVFNIKVLLIRSPKESMLKMNKTVGGIWNQTEHLIQGSWGQPTLLIFQDSSDLITTSPRNTHTHTQKHIHIQLLSVLFSDVSLSRISPSLLFREFQGDRTLIPLYWNYTPAFRDSGQKNSLKYFMF